MSAHVYIWEEEQNVNTEGLFGAGRKYDKYLHSKLPLKRTRITRMQFLIAFDRHLRMGSISTLAVTTLTDHSQERIISEVHQHFLRHSSFLTLDRTISHDSEEAHPLCYLIMQKYLEWKPGMCFITFILGKLLLYQNLQYCKFINLSIMKDWECHHKTQSYKKSLLKVPS